jgi:hypothetical protein
MLGHDGGINKKPEALFQGQKNYIDGTTVDVPRPSRPRTDAEPFSAGRPDPES